MESEALPNCTACDQISLHLNEGNITTKLMVFYLKQKEI